MKKYHAPVPLDESCQRKSFDCGDESLNAFIRKFALQNQKKDANRTYVVIDDENCVIAYYALIAGEVTHENAAGFYQKFGFSPSPTDPLHYYLLVRDIIYNI